MNKLLEALQIGLDSAREVANNYHIAFKGYRPDEHESVDADVRKIEAAIAALDAREPEPVAALIDAVLDEISRFEGYPSRPETWARIAFELGKASAAPEPQLCVICETGITYESTRSHCLICGGVTVNARQSRINKKNAIAAKAVAPIDSIAPALPTPVLTPCRHCGFRVALNESPESEAKCDAPVASQDDLAEATTLLNRIFATETHSDALALVLAYRSKVIADANNAAYEAAAVSVERGPFAGTRENDAAIIRAMKSKGEQL